MPWHARHQIHTDRAQDLFLLEHRQARQGINGIETR
jgi:hypothetical protein